MTTPKYLEIFRQAAREAQAREAVRKAQTYEKNEINEKRGEGDGLNSLNSFNSYPQPSDKSRPFGRFSRTVTALEAHCPDHVPVGRWQQAVEDGKRFLAKWGEQAQALGWSSADLFGLHEIPAKPHPSYNRLSRYDATGLIWLLEGRPVVALTETTATIRNSKTGNITVYRRFDKPGARAGRRFAGRSHKHRRARP